MSKQVLLATTPGILYGLVIMKRSLQAEGGWETKVHSGWMCPETWTLYFQGQEQIRAIENG